MLVLHLGTWKELRHFWYYNRGSDALIETCY